MAKAGPPGTSIQIVLARLQQLGLSKADLARGMSVSQDYIYRILGGRATFPRSRETLERLAAVCELDPYAFGEYRERDQQLSISTRLVWERMRERGMSREDLYNAMGARISRPYFNSILRGDQPFPTNHAYVQMFALALALPPTVFPEFGPRVPPRWAPEEIEDQEVRSYNLFFDRMMADYGFAQHPVPLRFLDPARVDAFFLPKAEMDPALLAVLARMGQLGMGFRELEKVCGVPRERLARLFAEELPAAQRAGLLAPIRQALRMEATGDPLP